MAVSVWNFATQFQREHARGKTPREVASRILNWACTEDYPGLRWISAEAQERVLAAFAEDESVLYRWSVTSPMTDMVTRALTPVNEAELRELLLDKGRFDIERTLSPQRQTRRMWIDQLQVE